MHRASPAHLERARQVLALEGSTEKAGAASNAACRTYEQLHTHLDPLLGAPGVQALLIRSARLTNQDACSLEEAMVKGSIELLRERLDALTPAEASDIAAALFGTFFALITTFIGERLTTQALRKAWPTLNIAVPKESEK